MTPLTMRGRLQGIFYDEFYMPWAVFDQLHHMLIGVKGFQDKKCGEGGRGMRTRWFASSQMEVLAPSTAQRSVCACPWGVYVGSTMLP